MKYPLPEKIGDPDLLVGREKEFALLNRWLDGIPKRGSETSLTAEADMNPVTGNNTDTEVNMSPSLNHSYLCKRLIVEIEKSGKWEAWPELALDIEGGLVPDIAVYQAGVLKPDFTEDIIRCKTLPQIAVEIISPSQSVHNLLIKAGKFIKAGIPAVWTVEPYGGIIYISAKEGRRVAVAELVESEGVRVNFAEIFGKE
jgi:Uma2 family endonuclease